MKTVILTAALAALTVSGCAREPAAESEPPLTDAALQEIVSTRLQTNANVAQLNLQVAADAETNAVELQGTAYTQKQRTDAVELARSARAGIEVQDKIDVKPYEMPRNLFDDEMMAGERSDASKMGDELGDSLDDGWLHMKVVAKLIADNDTPQRTINVDVRDNVVTLRGNVPTAEGRAEAESIAKSVEGVKDVRNRLVVKPQ